MGLQSVQFTSSLVYGILRLANELFFRGGGGLGGRQDIFFLANTWLYGVFSCIVYLSSLLIITNTASLNHSNQLIRWWMVSFSSFARILGEWPFIPRIFLFLFLLLLLLVLLLFCFEVEISSRTLIPLFRPGSVHSCSASWDDCVPNVPWQGACELVSG